MSQVSPACWAAIQDRGHTWWWGQAGRPAGFVPPGARKQMGAAREKGIDL